MHKSDFENNYDGNLKKLANDLKALIYDEFDKDFKKDLIKYEREPEYKNLRNREKKTFNVLVQNSAMNIKSYFIKIRKDENYTHLIQNKSLYFNVSISRNDANVNYYLKNPTMNIVELVAKTLGKP
ncbi:hypothetical protein YYG_01916 [Plasmodium vinckei petteri]|uniref:Uncharacterized protein n=1 Tax=Plasmodium vinckei petteri TaxID=138298 RepID=W7B4S6_PLAVN|nr:hypothetical protein YYG_01916 [Plasmodium vinckei petteri]